MQARPGRFRGSVSGTSHTLQACTVIAGTGGHYLRDGLHNGGQVGDLRADVLHIGFQLRDARAQARGLAKLVGGRLPADGAHAVPLRRDREGRIARHALALLGVALGAVLEFVYALLLQPMHS